MNPIELIKSRLDIVDIVSEHVQLKKTGRNYSGFCPFHTNTNTPAFSVFADSQTWKCFGACNEGGDIFSFVMKKNGWEFREALQYLAQRAGVSLEEYTPEQKAKLEGENHLLNLLDEVADYYHALFNSAPQAEMARQYVTKRGLKAETIQQFKIGYALDAWDACRNHFLHQGYTEDDLLDVGLLSENPEKGTRYDRFRQRLMVPIRNSDGRVVGFGARTLDPEGQPKYLNSPQTQFFDKSSLLFGLDLAKRPVREARQAVIVEGYMDVIQAWQAGYRNVVAQMGTALTQEQLNQLKRYTKRFVIALDSDAAGVKATMRSLEVARETLDRTADSSFDAVGLVKHEGRLQADIRVVALPAGDDPDSLIRRDPAAWEKLVSQAKPVVEYVIATLTAGLDLDDPKAKTEVAQQVIPLIEDVTNPVEREHYWQALGRALRTDDRALRRLVVTDKKRGTPRPDTPTPTTPRSEPTPVASPARQKAAGGQKKEMNYLRECLADVQILHQVNTRLIKLGLPIVDRPDFSHTADQQIFQLLQKWPAGVAADQIGQFLDPLLHPRLSDLFSLPTTEPEMRPVLVDKLLLSILDWRLEKIQRENNELKQLIREAKRQNNNEQVQQYTRQQLELVVTIGRIDKAKTSLSSSLRRRTKD